MLRHSNVRHLSVVQTVSLNLLRHSNVRHLSAVQTVSLNLLRLTVVQTGPLNLLHLSAASKRKELPAVCRCNGHPTVESVSGFKVWLVENDKIDFNWNMLFFITSKAVF